eukprot:CAMPEP_0175123610 /NCGR_PEP_ID=MMETSP0087-20121206/2337_1 /TAXON_ID=136419 /ORGANISM="Unknown Unknown, Strain D1" /LENGTH=1012 /DNA_ID=CAMNT_0016405317 /DNA_START=173 /DNA_END=3211 /DNA_ORIENTATION=-
MRILVTNPTSDPFIITQPTEDPKKISFESCKHSYNAISNLLEDVESRQNSILASMRTRGKRLPRMIRLGETYKLNDKELKAFVFLVLKQAHQSRALRDVLQADAYTQEVMGLDETEQKEVMQTERAFIKEGVMLVDESYDGSKSCRLCPEAVAVITGKSISTQAKYSLAQTAVLRVLEEDEGKLDTNQVDSSLKADDDIPAPNPDNSASNPAQLFQSNPATAVPEENTVDTDTKEPLSINELLQSLDSSSGQKELELPSIDGFADSEPEEEQKDEEQKRSTPYLTSLDYLEDRFQLLVEQIHLSKLKKQEDLAGVVQQDSFRWGEGKKKIQNIHEYKAKGKLVESRISQRLQVTSSQNHALPRLESLCQKLGLGNFEKNCLVLLVGAIISPVVKAVLQDEDRRYSREEPPHVQTILQTFCNSFKEQVNCRKHFYKSAPLLSRGIIKLKSTYSSGGDLIDQLVILDRRMFDWIVGLETEIAEVVEGSNLYTPSVSLQQVVLPAAQKDEILTTVENVEKWKHFRVKANLEETFSYGNGIVILFCGGSGTGKTMTVNAVAKKLDKRVLLVNFDVMQSEKTGVDLPGLFREAEMNDSILFFDECESIFSQRFSGGSSTMTHLLTEMERHKGIIFLATNRPFDLDEAMHRRITKVFEFQPPNHAQREEIWKLHTSNGAIKLCDDVDFEALAVKYELSGGFIKNAVVSAMLLAVGRDENNPVLTQDDLASGCAFQMRGSLQMKTFAERVVPRGGLDTLILSSTLKENLENIVGFEKARTFLYSQWGFSKGIGSDIGTKAMFWGAPGTGKSLAAEAMGFEIGKPLKVINFGELVSEMNNAGSGKNGMSKVLNAVFNDAKLMDAVLVLDKFHLEGERDSLQFDMILHAIEQFPGVLIIIVSSRKSLDLSLHLLDPDFVRHIRFLVDFKVPTNEQRLQLWKHVVPKELPLSSNVDFKELATLTHGFTGGFIASCLFQGAAMAALRKPADRKVKMADLKKAIERNKAKSKGEITSACESFYT